MNEPIKNIEDLSRQTKIKYGFVRGGATEHFFKVCLKLLIVNI
jgi:hypothetical protein